METETSGPYALDGDPPVWDDYRETIKQAKLGFGTPADRQMGFIYEAVSTPGSVLTIQSADQQRYANILLTIGVRMD